MKLLPAGKRLRSPRRYTALGLMMIPGLLYLLINSYLPMFGVIIAFKDYRLYKCNLGSDWIGFKNFEYLFKTSDALLITRNTILCNAVFICLNMVVPVAVAILLNEVRKPWLWHLPDGDPAALS